MKEEARTLLEKGYRALHAAETLPSVPIIVRHLPPCKLE